MTRSGAAGLGALAAEAARAASPRHRLIRIVETVDDPVARAEAMDAAIADIEQQATRLLSMSYSQLVAEKHSWLCTPPVHPDDGQQWGDDWTKMVEAALRDRLVLKRYLLGGSCHAVNVGRVVGSVEHSFEVLFEDGYHESLNWHELRPVLVPHASRDAELSALESDAGGVGICRASNRPRRVRDKAADVEAYVPRLACHHSLPVGKVGCHLHESMRLSGLFEAVDPGPAASD